MADTTVGKASVTLGLDAEQFKKAIIDANKKTEELKEAWQKSVKALKEVQLEMANTVKPTTKMREELAKLTEEVKRNKLAYEVAKGKSESLVSSLQGNVPVLNRIKGAFNSVGISMGALTKVAIVGALAKGLYDLGKQAVITASEFEQLNAQFEVMAGDKGKELLQNLIKLASQTPLTTKSLADNARTLLSFGISVQDITEDLRMLGDIAGGDEQRLQSLTLAFSQISSTGRLMGQDLLQLINAGFNPLQVMSEKTGKSMATLKKEMSDGKITFQMVKQAMIDATSEGGRFYQNMQKQSETLSGRLSTLSDNWALVSKNIGDKFIPAAKGAVELLNKLTQGVYGLLTAWDDFTAGLTMQSIEGLEGRLKIAQGTVDSIEKIFASGEKTSALTVKQYGNWVLEEINATLALFDATSDWLEKNNKQAEQLKKGVDGITTKGTDKALNEYQKFVDSFKDATNEYQATLKARDYVQKTLGIASTSEDYEGALTTYKEYFKQILDIAQSGAKNKAALLKMNEQKLQQDLQMVALAKVEDTEKKQRDLIKDYQKEMRTIEADAQAKEEAGGFFGSFGAGYQERLNILKWYYQEYDKITNTHFTDEQTKLDAYNQLTLIKEKKMAQTEAEIWEQRGHEIVGIFENTFSQMLTNYGSFSDNMKQLALNLIQYLLKEELSYALKSIEYEKMRTLAIQAIRGIGSFFGGLFGGGGMAMAGAIAHSGHYFVPSAKYHSGGITSDQTEHFALIKNNERVLSPSETTSYNNNEQQGGGNYIVYAPVVRAMDSKDVANWFNENKMQVINIVSQGIKDNTQGLRTQVQGV